MGFERFVLWGHFVCLHTLKELSRVSVNWDHTQWVVILGSCKKNQRSDGFCIQRASWHVERHRCRLLEHSRTISSVNHLRVVGGGKEKTVSMYLAAGNRRFQLVVGGDPDSDMRIQRRMSAPNEPGMGIRLKMDVLGRPVAKLSL